MTRMRNEKQILIGIFIGLVVGASLTAWVLHMVSLHGGSEDYMWLIRPFYLCLWLSRSLCELLGVHWPIAGRVASRGSLEMIYTTNSIAIGLVGAFCGFVLRVIQAKKQSHVRA